MVRQAHHERLFNPLVLSLSKDETPQVGAPTSRGKQPGEGLTTLALHRLLGHRKWVQGKPCP